jgi:hypothetical protein
LENADPGILLWLILTVANGSEHNYGKDCSSNYPGYIAQDILYVVRSARNKLLMQLIENRKNNQANCDQKYLSEADLKFFSCERKKCHKSQTPHIRRNASDNRALSLSLQYESLTLVYWGSTIQLLLSVPRQSVNTWRQDVYM